MTNARTTIWVMAIVLCLASSPVLAWIGFADGDTHDITYEINDQVRVDYHAPGMSTTLNLLPGGSITAPHEFRGYEDSQINILGGSIGALLFAWDRTYHRWVDILAVRLGQQPG